MLIQKNAGKPSMRGMIRNLHRQLLVDLKSLFPEKIFRDVFRLPPERKFKNWLSLLQVILVFEAQDFHWGFSYFDGFLILILFSRTPKPGKAMVIDPIWWYNPSGNTSQLVIYHMYTYGNTPVDAFHGFGP